MQFPKFEIYDNVKGVGPRTQIKESEPSFKGEDASSLILVIGESTMESIQPGKQYESLKNKQRRERDREH